MEIELSGDEMTNLVVNLEVLSNEIPENPSGSAGAIMLQRDSSNRINFRVLDFVTGVGLANVGLDPLKTGLRINAGLAILTFMVSALYEYGNYRNYTDDETLVIWSLMSNRDPDKKKPTISERELITSLIDIFEPEYIKQMINMFVAEKVFHIKFDKREKNIFIKEAVIQL